MNDDNHNNPFTHLSQIFIDNQRQFNLKVDDLKNRTDIFKNKLSGVLDQLNVDPFSANLNCFINIEEEARLILQVAKELEYQKDKIGKSIDLPTESKKTKLYK